jgi:hypothetical protein
MTYSMAGAVQRAVYERLESDDTLMQLVGGAVFDAVPQVTPDIFVALGAEDVRARGDVSGTGAVHDLTISVVTSRHGYISAKDVAVRVSDLLAEGLPMVRGRMVSMRFLRARARRDEGEGTRRIDLRFRARVDEDLQGA